MSTEPVDLVGSTFDIVEVHGVSVLASSCPDITFGVDDRVSGRASVNRLMGQYSIEAGVLRLGALATTMMAGPPELMEQEQRVLSALGQPLRIETDDDGAVRLVSDDGAVLLRRQPAVDGAL